MVSVIEGLALVALMIVAGYLASLFKVVRGSERLVLNRVSFYVATPALMYVILQQSELDSIFSPVVLVVALSAVFSFLCLIAVSKKWFKRDAAETTLLGASASYVNATALGLPIAIYVLGDGAFAAALALLQMLVVVPAIITVLERAKSGKAGNGRLLLRTASNPVFVASLAGFLVSAFAIETPNIILRPLDALGASAIPLILISFGASLQGQSLPGRGGNAAPVVTASAIKLVIMPLAAWALTLAFQLDASQTLAAVTLAALPTAQNLFTYAATYQRGEIIVRDVIALTTVATLPVILLIQWVFA